MVGRDVEQVVARAVGPSIPVADEDLGIDVAGRLVGLAVGDLFDRAGDLVALAFREDRHGDDQALAVGRDLEGLDVERQFRHLHGPHRRIDEDLPYLGGAVAAAPRQEIQALAVGRELGVGITRLGALHRIFRRPRRGQVLQHQRADALILVHVGGADAEHDQVALGVDIEAAEAVQHQHVRIGERLFGVLGMGHAAQPRQRHGAGQQQGFQGHSGGVSAHDGNLSLLLRLLRVKAPFCARVERRRQKSPK